MAPFSLWEAPLLIGCVFRKMIMIDFCKNCFVFGPRWNDLCLNVFLKNYGCTKLNTKLTTCSRFILPMQFWFIISLFFCNHVHFRQTHIWSLSSFFPNMLVKLRKLLMFHNIQIWLCDTLFYKLSLT